MANWQTMEIEKFGCSEAIHSQMHLNNFGIPRFTVQMPIMDKKGCVDCLLACLQGDEDELTMK
jgi:hypothetical protein